MSRCKIAAKGPIRTVSASVSRLRCTVVSLAGGRGVGTLDKGHNGVPVLFPTAAWESTIISKEKAELKFFFF